MIALNVAGTLRVPSTGSVRRFGSATSRRRFLQAGAIGCFGLSLPTLLRAAAERPDTADASFGRAKRCLLVFLNGGPSQLDTWDMKPEAPAEVRGELKPIATSIPGIQASELLPLLARETGLLKVVRSVTHEDTEHTTGMCTMLTGTYHPRPNVAQTEASPHDHPNLGAIYAKLCDVRRQGETTNASTLPRPLPGREGSSQTSNHLPPFVSLPTLFQPPGNGVWPGQDGGFLGKRFAPFVISGEKKTAHFTLPEIELPVEMTAGRLENRHSLLAKLDAGLRTLDRSQRLAEVDQFYGQAFSLISSNRLVEAVDLAREPDVSRNRYGRHLFGQGVLLARRLIEAEIPLVTVYWIDPQPPGIGGGEYDSHGRIYHHMRNRLVPPTDRALSALFSDLSERGLLHDTLVVVMAEFGRTPRLNKDAGRDHWPQAQSILLAGAGISGGSVYGATDRHAAFPESSPVTPPDLAQTVLHLLGVPADLELHDPQGRPVRACSGAVVPALFA
ncbi:MAG: DUF1501 domain-containing protein [Planctomycetaceae bacterium]